MEIFDEDVISKSSQTFGLLALVAIIVIFAGRFMDSRERPIVSANGNPNDLGSSMALDINPLFTSIRHGTIAILVVSISLLALLGVLAIWEVLSGEVLNKSLSSISIIAFASLVIVITCLEREKHKLMQRKMSGWVILLIILFAWPFFSLLF